MTRQIKSAILTVLLLATALAGAFPAKAANFVSLNGKFYITYPADWHQIDFNTVDYYLSQSNASRQTFQYEGVFAPASGVSFQYGPYLILTVDTLGTPDNRRIDSVLNELSKGIEKPIARSNSGNPLAELTIDAPQYDATSKLVAVLSTVGEAGQVPRTSLLAVKFYERGIANFYFYAPDSMFEQVKPVFQSILASFSTENLQAAMPKEELRVADPDKMQSDSSTGSKTRRNTFFGSGGFIVIMLVILIAARKRKRRKAQKNLQP